ncbi:cadherin domain protein [Dictyocaulus viviparus]|uniref:Cadherin domain protein n=1 Tax=Dictyocaulus viviparus TaxID=29172 RepID=A0A0D8XJ18_DICVI|nr:cadherin domain protein [Dictyocaulus viviparus]
MLCFRQKTAETVVRGHPLAQAIVNVHLNRQRNSSEASPRFERNRYVFHAAENRPPAVIGVVRAYHVALSSNEVSLQYEIVYSTEQQTPFRIQSSSGEISNEATLDYETKTYYEFKIRACLSVNPNSCGYSSVVVIVVDVNDNTPRFSSPQFQISLPSDLPIHSEIITLQAIDADSGANGDVTYFINPSSAVFAIDERSAVVETISWLTEPRYDLIIEAYDHGIPKRHSSTRLTIAVHGSNPSAPMFDKKRYEVILNSPVRAGAVVAELHAKDPDPGAEGQISYRFEHSNVMSDAYRKFTINENTGVISALDRISSESGPFDFIVIAEDQSTTFKRKTSTSVHIEVVDDTSLRFLSLPSTIYISTEKAIGSVVLRASAYTSSSSPVYFRILENHSQFVMDGDLLRIPIESEFPLVVHRFDAHVLNGTVRYRFFPDGSEPEALHLNNETTNIKLKSDHFTARQTASSLQCTRVTIGELSVISDYGIIPSNHDTQFVVVRAVNIDFPDFYSDVGVALNLISSKALRFPHSIYRFEIEENIPTGTALSPPVEVFPKSPFVKYSIVPSSPLSILPNGTLVINSPIDIEQLPVDQASNLLFLVTSKVGVVKTTTKVQLNIRDINEFSPQFEQKFYEVTMPKNFAPGSLIVQVNAFDEDKTEGSHLLYKVAGGSGKDLVLVREDGVLVLSDKIADWKPLESFDVMVEALDKDGNSDDNRPIFASQSLTWNVSEGVTNVTLEILASNEDSGLNGDLEFRIIEGNDDNHFVIDSTSSNSVERMKKTKEKLGIVLNNEGSQLYIFCPPQYLFNDPLSEDGQVADLLSSPTRVSLLADEIDIGFWKGSLPKQHDSKGIVSQTRAMTFACGFNCFTMKATALLRIITPLDFESKSVFNLLLQATDSSNPPKTSTSTITVNVINRNDNPPIFQKDDFDQEISSDLPVGYPILILAVSDVDHDPLSFSLSGNQECSSMIVNSSGIVTLSKSLTRRARIITCVISVTDGIHTSNANLKIRVSESVLSTMKSVSKNHPPRFADEVHTVTLNSSLNNRLIANVTAVDPDGDAVRYSIEPEQFREFFSVDSEGQLFLRVSLSKLKQPLYSFLVVAEDSGKPMMSSFINIEVHLPENNSSLVILNSLEDNASSVITLTSSTTYPTIFKEDNPSRKVENSVTPSEQHFSPNTIDSSPHNDRTTLSTASTVSSDSGIPGRGHFPGYYGIVQRKDY